MGTKAEAATKSKARSAKSTKEAERDLPLPPLANALLSRERVALALGITTRSLDQMRSAGTWPGPDKAVGKSPRWSCEAFNEGVRNLPPWSLDESTDHRAANLKRGR